MRLFEKFSIFLNDCYKYGACAFLVIVIDSTFLQVFTRYVLNNSLSWTEELARYAFIWMNMLAAPVAVRKGMHASVNILEKICTGNILAVHKYFIYFFIIITAYIMISQGVMMMEISTEKLSIVLRISMHYIYISIPIGGFGILIQALSRSIMLFRRHDKEIT